MTFCTFPDVCRPSNLITSRPPNSPVRSAGHHVSRRATSSECRGFNDVDAADAVDEIDQSALVDGRVVGGHAIAAAGRIRQKMSDLPGRERIGDVNEAQALREPGKRDHCAAQTLRWLMTPAHRRLRAAVAIEPGHL